MKRFHYAGDEDKVPYHYTMCGLDDVYLVSGYQRKDTPYGGGVVIHNMGDLHRSIGEHLVCSKKTLTGKELRFLRHEMDLTQEHLSSLLRVTDQTVARWEKGEVSISGPADLLMRGLYLGHISEKFDVRALADKLRTADAPAEEKQFFAPTDHGWEALAAA